MKKHLLSALAAIVLCFVACNKEADEPTPTPSEPVAVTGVSLNKTMVALEIGESVTVEATVTPETAVNKEVKWSIANTAIATVSNGVVTGVAAGETELTVTTADGGHTTTIPVKVVTEKVPVVNVLMDYPSQILEGEEGFISVLVMPLNATNRNVTITLSDPEVLSIKYKGPNTDVPQADDYTIKGLKPGTCTIKAVSDEGGFERECTITVRPIIKVSSITIGAQATKIGIGEVTYLNANLQPERPDEDGIEWSSSNPGIATVEDSAVKHGAKVTGVAAGKATITATAKDGSGVKGSIEIEVVTVPTSITFDGKTDIDIHTWWGKKVDLKAKVTPDGASLKTLTWQWLDPNSSSNPDGVKYNVTDDKATLTYTWPSQTSKLRGVDVRAFYGNGMTVYARANVYFQTFAWLLKYSEDAINYDGLYPFSEDFNYKWNWENKGSNKLAFIAYYRSDGSENALPQYYKEYYIPTSEYTLTSSDPSKVKVTKSADGESWDIERLNTTDLAAVTLTYKCGDHTQTYTINLIP